MARCPTSHALRHAWRTPWRSALLALGAGLVAALFAATTAFTRSLEASHQRAAPERTMLLLSRVAEQDLVRSSMAPVVADLLLGAVPGIERYSGEPALSSEIHLTTEAGWPRELKEDLAFVRGVTRRALLVHDAVTLTEGDWPQAGEVLVGRVARGDRAAAVGDSIALFGQSFRIAGFFAARGTTLEGELWLRLEDLQQATRRSDLSAIFAKLVDANAEMDVLLFAARRLDLELEALSAATYYEGLATWFRPIKALSFGMAALIALAAAMGGANTLIAGLHARRREFAVMGAMGFGPRAIFELILVELLAVGLAGAILGLAMVRLLFRELSVSMAMSAFRVEIDAPSLCVGLFGLLFILLLAVLPAWWRLVRVPVVQALAKS